MNLTQKPYLNLGCGRIILPAPRPAHHTLVDEGIYAYPLWLNADRNAGPGVDQIVDLFRYPWPWADNAFDGALLSHLVEHVPHEIRTAIIPPYDWDERFDWHAREQALAGMQDGWYAFFAELHRVLTPNAIAHILAPYGWSQGAITDPTHTRLITEHTFTHAMGPEPDAPFRYETGGLHFDLVEPPRFGLYPMFAHLAPTEDDTPDQRARKTILFQEAIMTRINVVNDLAVKIKAIKPS